MKHTHHSIALTGPDGFHSSFWPLRLRAWLKGVLGGAVVCAVLAQSQAQLVLIPRGASWKYLDAGTNLPATWPTVGFDDSQWPAGIGPLGYGRDDLTTVIDQAGRKPVTTQFRHTFTNSANIGNLTLRIRRNDGAVIYLNGEEKIRSGMPLGPINSATWATASVPPEEETNYVQYGIFVWYLPFGPNTVAVEVHQAADGTNDCSFDAELIANLPIQPPTIELISPTNGSIFAEGEPITLTTVVSDSDGHVKDVTFYADGISLGVVSLPPYNLVWSNAPPGRHIVMATARDNHNRTADSAKVRIQAGSGLADRLVRGPYLNMGTPTSIVICWGTDWTIDSRVVYGTAPDQLSSTAEDEGATLDHEIALTGLLPDTKYYYAVGTRSNLLASSPDYSFVTAPTRPKPVRIWALGDSRTGDAKQRAVRDAYEEYSQGQHTDLYVHLGDQTSDGTEEQFQSIFFDVYSNLLQRTVLWPTRGNHELDPAYFKVFSLPTQGEAGGVPSGSESYYSHDYANIHFVVLDSSYSDASVGGPMYEWLEADLAAQTNFWLIAYWHAPPYTKGCHDSDYETECVVMRTNFLPLLEAHGVDLVLGGHTHSYERSYLIDGHYEQSWTLVPTMVKDWGDGRPEGDGPYYKLRGPHQGAVYVVAGSGGALEGGTFDHPAMHFSESALGSLVLDIAGDTLQAKFLRESEQIDDAFTLVKVDPAAGPRIISIQSNQGSVTLSWICVPGAVYQVSWCERLGRAWSVIAEDLETTTFVLSWTHYFALDHPSGFYRVEQVGP